MSAEYSIDALTAEERRLMDAIEADLDRVMAVEPSADFAARVRARIGEADRDARWNVPWAIAAAAVLVIAAGVLLATLRDQPSAVDSAAIVTGHDVALPAPKLPPAVTAAGRSLDVASARPRHDLSRVPIARRAAAGGSRIDRAVEPEVLVPDDLRLAVARVMRMVRDGTISERAFAPEHAASAVEEPAEAVGAMVIEELHVPSIDPAGGGVEKGFGGD